MNKEFVPWFKKTFSNAWWKVPEATGAKGEITGLKGEFTGAGFAGGIFSSDIKLFKADYAVFDKSAQLEKLIDKHVFRGKIKRSDPVGDVETKLLDVKRELDTELHGVKSRIESLAPETKLLDVKRELGAELHEVKSRIERLAPKVEKARYLASSAKSIANDTGQLAKGNRGKIKATNRRVNRLENKVGRNSGRKSSGSSSGGARGQVDDIERARQATQKLKDELALVSQGIDGIESRLNRMSN
ncbi:hypothetical protein [Actinomadura atramentaria]|uniref:hypothetical protein n=1 Tax=Actinomadura atramentaria TaxID=1990 RepID=UPI0012F889EA|nr:hypothetical protein [Actinomadura atramentaria]